MRISEALKKERKSLGLTQGHKILSWLESLATDPELCFLRELTLYFYFIYTNDDQAKGIKLILDQSGYKKISDDLPD